MKTVDRRHDFADVTYKEVHDLIFPADVRTSDSIAARIRLRNSKGEFESARVWKISPLGIELILPEFIDAAKGDAIDLQLQVGRQRTSFDGLVVDILDMSNNSRIAGIRLSGKKPKSFGNSNRRKSTRWRCSSQFYPVAICANPIEFNDFIYLRIRDLSAGGIRVITSLRNKFLVPGMKLTLQISFPMVGHANVTTEIKRANLTAEDDKDFLELGLSFLDLSDRDRETMGQYLIQFSDAHSLDSIREQGLHPKSLVAALDYCYVKTEADFHETLKLRYLANLGAGKIPDSFDPSDMSDVFDARSRIINWSYNGRHVGTARTTFSENDEKLEIENFIELPTDFPRRDEIAEIGRAATHPEYRKSDLFNNILQRCSIVCLQANRSFVLLSTTPELITTYEKVGLTNTGLTYVHPLYPEQTQHLLYGDIKEAMSGRTVGLVAWSLVWKEVLDYVVATGQYRPSELITSKVRVYKALSPLVAVAKLFMSRPRRA